MHIFRGLLPSMAMKEMCQKGKKGRKTYTCTHVWKYLYREDRPEI
jgi:hypothetical protein